MRRGAFKLGYIQRRELFVYIRLFAEMGFSEYTVVVGRLIDTEYKAFSRETVRGENSDGEAQLYSG